VSGADTGTSRARRGEHNTAPDKLTRTGTDAQAPLPSPHLILIAEDEEPIAEALTFIVEDAGYTPLVARHGKEALELARATRPALVITDLMMPHMDGTALIAALREEARLNGHGPLRIILMTAAGVRKADEAGADVVVHKPFNLADVDALIRRMMEE
jgi:DNA-binding response OmpR family regulator